MLRRTLQTDAPLPAHHVRTLTSGVVFFDYTPPLLCRARPVRPPMSLVVPSVGQPAYMALPLTLTQNSRSEAFSEGYVARHSSNPRHARATDLIRPRPRD